jgi:hypothetical protein
MAHLLGAAGKPEPARCGSRAASTQVSDRAAADGRREAAPEGRLSNETKGELSQP